jgi:hypothetical protein
MIDESRLVGGGGGAGERLRLCERKREREEIGRWTGRVYNTE